LNYTSDSSSDDNSNHVEIQNHGIKNSTHLEISKFGSSSISKENPSNSRNDLNTNTSNSLIVRKVPSTTSADLLNFQKGTSTYIRNQLMKLPSPKFKTTSYSDLPLDGVSGTVDDDVREKQVQKNVQHELEKENKRKREELYQTYRTSAQLNGLLSKPVKPYVSKRQKKTTTTTTANNNNISNNNSITTSSQYPLPSHKTSPFSSSSSFPNHDEILTENSKKVLYINSSFLHKPSTDYFHYKKFTHGIPTHTTGQLFGHTKGINVLRWKPDDGYLLASASMDFTACIWDVFNSKKPARIIPHQGAVKDIQWRNDNTHVLTASFDKTIKLFDVEAGKVVQTFNNQDMVNVLRFHPKDQDLFIAGLYKKGIVCWDVRSNRIVSEYKGFFGQVQDLEFLEEGKTFLAASDIVKRNSTDKAIVVWDFPGNVIISNQIYQEAYNCTALRVHPNKKKFIAQSNAGYIAIFDAKPPWTLDKFKRFESHSVSGNRIQCNFSPDGRYVGSGSSDGKLYFYDWKSSKCVRTLDYGVHAHATCMDVAWCPQPQALGYACVASGDNKGRIALWN